jgi:hypothetical protein
VSIVKIDADGALLGRRRSPRHGRPSDVFAELVSIAGLLPSAALEIDVVLVEVDELRIHRPDGPWRRRGWTVVERRLIEVLGSVSIRGLADLASLLPPDLPDPFTTAELADGLGCPRRIAQQAAYCLRVAEVIEVAGKRRHSVEYRLSATRDGSKALDLYDPAMESPLYTPTVDRSEAGRSR